MRFITICFCEAVCALPYQLCWQQSGVPLIEEPVLHAESIWGNCIQRQGFPVAASPSYPGSGAKPRVTTEHRSLLPENPRRILLFLNEILVLKQQLTPRRQKTLKIYRGQFVDFMIINCLTACFLFKVLSGRGRYSLSIDTMSHIYIYIYFTFASLFSAAARLSRLKKAKMQLQNCSELFITVHLLLRSCSLSYGGVA